MQLRILSRSACGSLSPSVGYGWASYKHTRRCLTTQRPARKPAPKRIAVLGGGVSGLSTAYYLSQSLPNVTVTLYEASSRFGGWLQSKRVQVPDSGGYVTFEQGPRTFKKSFWGLFTLALMVDLGLKDDLIFASKKSVAAQNRYIYDQDHILLLPNSIKSALWAAVRGEKVVASAIKEVLSEWRKEKRGFRVDDESIADFLARRGLKHTGEHVVSAVLHGIYAGDIAQLSAQSTPPFDYLYHQEYSHGSLTKGLFNGSSDQFATQTRFRELFDCMPTGIFRCEQLLLRCYEECSVFTVKDGLGSLVNALEKRLIQKHVLFVREGVTKLERSSDGIAVHTTRQRNRSLVKSHDLVISALPAQTTSEIALAGMDLESGSEQLARNRKVVREALPVATVTVMVVNLFYKQPGLVPHQGFGYLIPQTVPSDQNPERALGVIFDSDITPSSDSVRGTKLTVMLGGHYWDGWPAEALPTHEEGVRAAKLLLARHLQIEVEPALTNVALQKDCIPQYKVGHANRMEAAHQALQQTYEGRVRVLGNSYSGVGVHDCIVAARLMAMHIGNEVAEGEMRNDRTGLEQYAVLEESGWMMTRLDPRWQNFR